MGSVIGLTQRYWLNPDGQTPNIPESAFVNSILSSSGIDKHLPTYNLQMPDFNEYWQPHLASMTVSMPHITLAHQAQPNDDVLFQEVGGEAVLLNLASESYFGLNEVGTRIWSLLGENTQLQNAFDILSAEYNVEPAQLETDLLTLVDEMAKAGLVQVR